VRRRTCLRKAARPGPGLAAVLCFIYPLPLHPNSHASSFRLIVRFLAPHQLHSAPPSFPSIKVLLEALFVIFRHTHTHLQLSLLIGAESYPLSLPPAKKSNKTTTTLRVTFTFPFPPDKASLSTVNLATPLIPYQRREAHPLLQHHINRSQWVPKVRDTSPTSSFVETTTCTSNC
jgi:hypothetical protein